MDNYHYAIIGNCSSGALISNTASIDFLCLPNFQSQTVFAKLLDENIGGSFEICVDKGTKISQKYIADTNILSTHFTNTSGTFELIDFMPRYALENASIYHPPELIRFFRLISGKPSFSIRYNPKLCYAKSQMKHHLKSDCIKSFTAEAQYESLYLYSSFDAQKILNQETITLTEHAFCLMNYNQKIVPLDLNYIYLQYAKTKSYWLNWSAKSHKIKAYQKEVERSLLVLKLLTFEKTGAMLAALTTSLPESIGETRNWDYRFCWIRDAALTANVFNKMGVNNLAKNFIKFILSVAPFKNEAIQIMYDITGAKILTEIELDHLAGYQSSKPVRIGNEAYKQVQLDIYGFLMDIIYNSLSSFRTNLDRAEHLWTIVRNIVRHVENNWQKEDSGPWEFREKKQHFVFSKILCWVAVDRALKIAQLLRKDSAYPEWKTLLKAIKTEILEKAWDESLGAFTQAYGSKALDAANLLMQPYGFIAANDPKFISTVKVTHEHLCKEGALMLRYNAADDFGMPKSGFLVCSFWMIDALFKTGQKDLARRYFDTVLSYANEHGLLAEDVDFKSKRLLGNFPQAYSHLALISTALTLSEESPYDPNAFFENIILE